MLPELANKIVGIAKGDPKKPKGEMPVHAFFVKSRWGETYKEKSRDLCELCIFLREVKKFNFMKWRIAL